MKIDQLALIIGTMKGGTTSLHDYLSQHRLIAPCREKEPKFFSSDERFARGRDWYMDLHEVAPHHEWLLDGSTDCAKFPYCGDVPARIRAFGMKTRIIYIMRHPIRRMESHAQHCARTGREVNDILSDREDHSLDNGPSEVSLAVSDYAMQIDRFRPWFDRGEMLLLTSEELKSAPESVVARCCDFLGIEHLPSLQQPEFENRADAFIRPSRLGFMRHIPGVSPVLRAVLPGKIRAMAWEPLIPEGRYKFLPEEEAALTAKLEPQIKRLQQDYGVDTWRWWKLGEPG